jgi:hypothetical protein
MQLITKNVTLNCLRRDANFTLSVLVDKKNDKMSFYFQADVDAIVSFFLENNGKFNVSSSMNREIGNVSIPSLSPYFSSELKNTVVDFVKSYKMDDLTPLTHDFN